MLNVTVAAKSKAAFALFFDDAYNEALAGKGAFVRPNPGSRYKLGVLAGLVLHVAPGEMIVLTVEVKGGRDIVAAYNFFDVAEGTKIVANLINVPTSAAGDQIIGAIEDGLARLKLRLGSAKEAPSGRGAQGAGKGGAASKNAAIKKAAPARRAAPKTAAKAATVAKPAPKKAASARRK